WLARAHDAASDLPPLVFAGPGVFPVSERRRKAGYVPERELHRVLAGASALVLPSADEGFGLPVLEAMACDVPVVCADIPALREVRVGDAKSHHVPSGDIVGWPEALERARDEPHPAHASARRRAHAASFTWRHCAQMTVEAYHTALR